MPGASHARPEPRRRDGPGPGFARRETEGVGLRRGPVRPLEWGESFGIVLIEAMAAGVPVIASDIPGYRAVLAEGSAGVLVPPDDPGALETALANVLTNTALRQDLSSRASLGPSAIWDRLVGQVVEAYADATPWGREWSASRACRPSARCAISGRPGAACRRRRMRTRGEAPRRSARSECGLTSGFLRLVSV